MMKWILILTTLHIAALPQVWAFEQLSPLDFFDLIDDLGCPELMIKGVDVKTARETLEAAQEWAKTDEGDLTLVGQTEEGLNIGPVYLQAQRLHTSLISTNCSTATLDSFPTFEDLTKTLVSETGNANDLSIADFWTWPCNIFPYRCPWTIRYLWFVPMTLSNGLTVPCYVPFPQLQAITYATCDCDTCRAAFRPGRCVPSCYERRRFLLACLRGSSFFWSYQNRYVPQSCQCRTC